MSLEWLKDVVLGNPDHPSIAHTVFVLAFVIASGIALSRIKIKGISLGMTWILFTGIAVGHFGVHLHPETLHFIKEFGLILFVFFIGLQVGPGFFSSLKSGGLTLIGLAALVILLGGVTTYVIHLITGEPLPTMVGVMSGAVTNTAGSWCCTAGLYRCCGRRGCFNLARLCRSLSVGCRGYHIEYDSHASPVEGGLQEGGRGLGSHEQRDTTPAPLLC